MKWRSANLTYIHVKLGARFFTLCGPGIPKWYLLSAGAEFQRWNPNEPWFKLWNFFWYQRRLHIS